VDFQQLASAFFLQFDSHSAFGLLECKSSTIRRIGFSYTK
jgi:hypothetical protein